MNGRCTWAGCAYKPTRVVDGKAYCGHHDPNQLAKRANERRRREAEADARRTAFDQEHKAKADTLSEYLGIPVTPPTSRFAFYVLGVDEVDQLLERLKQS